MSRIINGIKAKERPRRPGGSELPLAPADLLDEKSSAAAADSSPISMVDGG